MAVSPKVLEVAYISSWGMRLWLSSIQHLPNSRLNDSNPANDSNVSDKCNGDRVSVAKALMLTFWEQSMMRYSTLIVLALVGSALPAMAGLEACLTCLTLTCGMAWRICIPVLASPAGPECIIAACGLAACMRCGAACATPGP